MTERVEAEYMALGGDEVLEIIHRKVKDTLGAYNQYFGAHLAYHNPHIRLAVNVECYTPEHTKTDGGFELVVDLTKGPCMEPDRLRDEVGIGTYETKLVDEHSGTLANVKVNVKPDPQETAKKIEKILGPTVMKEIETIGPPDEASKPKPRAKTRRAKKRGGWPKGKPRGPRAPSVPAVDPVVAEAS